jgi:hypothetical protein
MPTVVLQAGEARQCRRLALLPTLLPPLHPLATPCAAVLCRLPCSPVRPPRLLLVPLPVLLLSLLGLPLLPSALLALLLLLLPGQEHKVAAGHGRIHRDAQISQPLLNSLQGRGHFSTSTLRCLSCHSGTGRGSRPRLIKLFFQEGSLLGSSAACTALPLPILGAIQHHLAPQQVHRDRDAAAPRLLSFRQLTLTLLQHCPLLLCSHPTVRHS